MFQNIFTHLSIALCTIALFSCSNAVETASQGTNRTSNVSVELAQPASNSVVSNIVTIAWDNLNSKPSRVKILLSNNSGSSFNRELATISGVESYLWDSTEVVDGASYRIRLIPMDSNNVQGNISGHNEDFSVDNTVPDVSGITPISGQTLSGNSAQVTWVTNENNSGTVNIKLSTDSGTSFDNIIAQNAVDNGLYTFNTTAFSDGLNYQISIEATDAAGNTGLLAYSADFEISNTSPPVGPIVTGMARYQDNNFNNLVDKGDTLIVPFDQDIAISALTANDFSFPVSGDTLGDSPTFELSTSNEITITLGQNANLKITGAFGTEVTQIGSPSGIDVSAQIISGAISVPNGAVTAQAFQAIDIIPMYVESQLLRVCETKGVSLGYFNNDNFLDLAQSCDSTTLGTFIYLNDGNGNFTEVYELPANLTNGVKLVDLNNDRFADIVEINRFSGVNGTATSNVYLNDKNGGFGAAQSLGPDSSTAYSVVVADFNNDKQLDIIIGRYNLPSFLFINTNGVFTKSATQLPATRLSEMHAKDVNDDGNMDVIIGGQNSSPHSIYIGNGATMLTFLQNIPYQSAFGRMAFGKLDNDNFIDMVLASDSNSANEVFYNNKAGSFTSTGQTFGSNPTSGLALIDIDKDGDLDLFEATDYNTPAYVWINTGTGFVDSGARLSNRQTKGNLAVGDIDNDGDLDVIIGNAYQPSAVWKASYATP